MCAEQRRGHVPPTASDANGMSHPQASAGVGALRVCAGAIAVFGSLMIGSYQEALAATSVSTAVLPAAAQAHGSPSPTSPGGMPGMDTGYGKTAVSDRPLAPVLGTFTGGTSVVLLTAVLLRRRDRAARAARESARVTVMSQR